MDFNNIRSIISGEGECWLNEFKERNTVNETTIYQRTKQDVSNPRAFLELTRHPSTY
jgi:hypothetical protein